MLGEDEDVARESEEDNNDADADADADVDADADADAGIDVDTDANVVVKGASSKTKAKRSPTTLTPAAAKMSIGDTNDADAAGSRSANRINPFARSTSVVAAAKKPVNVTPSKRGGNSVFDAIHDLQQAARPIKAKQPSPAKKIRPALKRNASFAVEARKKQGMIFAKQSQSADIEKAKQLRERRSKKAHDVRA